MPSNHLSQLLSLDAITALSKIADDRYALTRLPAADFTVLRHEILTVLQAADESPWYLLGTDSCHLCQIVQTLIDTASAAYTTLPKVTVLDLADAADERMVDLLGRHIPILMTDRQLLCYPFGLMDIIHLASTH